MDVTERLSRFIFSLCTTLSLQWESDIVAVALMYLASRLSKVDFSVSSPCHITIENYVFYYKYIFHTDVGTLDLNYTNLKSFLQDWQGKQPGFKGKWYEALVQDITVDLIEGRHSFRAYM